MCALQYCSDNDSFVFADCRRNIFGLTQVINLLLVMYCTMILVKSKGLNTAFSMITYLKGAEVWHVLELKSQIRVSFASLLGKQ